ncbi:isocitrate lyase/phosphoenolpyruvate mutase family protein [Streptomyces albicerus]|uniref:isocitrate lyase/phosphoenolpyruvate mutase family protein n=1 Tax=Streptomyces albicerus TaxID=2569859 RepID=UPI00124BB984|nr:isocitrate lyase/phosphoenolpyruvate mutase family protein [Streptomyces albicerus]
MSSPSAVEKACVHRDAQRPGRCPVPPHAEDAACVAMGQATGTEAAAATTSASCAWAPGRADRQHLTVAEAVDSVRRIARAVPLPVTATTRSGRAQSPMR